MAPQAKSAAAPRKGGAAAARSERKKTRTIESNGLTLTLPAKLPFRVLRHLRTSEGGVDGPLGFLEDLLGEEQMEQVWALDIDVDEGVALVQQILDGYGLAEGEAPAS